MLCSFCTSITGACGAAVFLVYPEGMLNWEEGTSCFSSFTSSMTISPAFGSLDKVFTGKPVTPLFVIAAYAFPDPMYLFVLREEPYFEKSLISVVIQYSV